MCQLLSGDLSWLSIEMKRIYKKGHAGVKGSTFASKVMALQVLTANESHLIRPHGHLMMFVFIWNWLNLVSIKIPSAPMQLKEGISWFYATDSSGTHFRGSR